MDKISITGLKLTTLIGTLNWEQHVTQTLYCDVVFQTDAALIATTDTLKHAIDYDSMTTAIQHFVDNHHYQLIETLAHHLATFLLTEFPTTWIQLTLHKPGALKHAKDVTITIERTR